MTSRQVVEAARAVGLVRIRDLAADGVTEQALAARLRRGVWWRPLPRVVCLAAARNLTTEQRRLAALLWLPPCALLSHGDAAALWGVRVAETSEMHLSLDRRHMPRPQAGFALHRVDSIGDDRTVRNGLPVTSLERTVVDVHHLLAAEPDRRALVAHVFQTRRTTAGRLVAAIERVPKLHHRDELLRQVDLAAGGAHSVGEEEAADWLVAAGFPRPERQFPAVVGGRLRYLDLADPRLRIAYEVDGLHHGELAQRDADNQRDLELAADGWETVRLTTFRVRREPGRLRDTIARLRRAREAMAAAGMITPARRADAA